MGGRRIGEGGPGARLERGTAAARCSSSPHARAKILGEILSTELGRAVREDYALSIIVFDANQEIIQQWLP
jgi:hypothetical protein